MAVRHPARPGHGLEGYHDAHSYPEARAPARPRDLPVRRPAVLRQRQDLPRPDPPARRGRPGTDWILIAAEPITDIDTTAADMLEDLDETSTPRASAWSSPSSKTRSGARSNATACTRTINPDHFYPTIDAAITAFRHHTHARWTTTDQTASPQRDTFNHSAGLGGGNA